MDKLQTISGIASAREVAKVDLSEFGIDFPDGLYIKKLSALEMTRLLKMWDESAALEDIQKYVITAAVVEPNGRRLFDDPETDGKTIINEWPCDLVIGLMMQIYTYSGIIKDKPEQPEKN